VRRAPEALAAALREVDERRLRRRRVVATPVGVVARVAADDDAAASDDALPETDPRAAAPPVLAIDGRRYLNFCSNDYLGLATHPALAHAMAECARSQGAGAGASHLVSGHGPEHEALERELADFTGRERRAAVLDGLHGEPRRRGRARGS
jgi:7-keto-8-aminopelargonate synthetase-like enzyme